MKAPSFRTLLTAAVAFWLVLTAAMILTGCPFGWLTLPGTVIGAVAAWKYWRM